MGLARELEKRLERLVDGVSGAIFRGRVHPVDLGTRVIREADLSVTDGLAGPMVPNDYSIALNPEDLGTVEAQEQLAAELAYTLGATAVARGWRLEGPPRITVVADPTLKVNHLKIVGRVTPGEQTTWGQLIGTGRHADLGPNRVLIGRSDECDIRLDEPEVSRRHAIIHREQQRTWITDLGSANGTFVDGVAVTTTTPLRPGAGLTLGPATFMFRLVE
jgi:hypothetical protein